MSERISKRAERIAAAKARTPEETAALRMKERGFSPSPTELRVRPTAALTAALAILGDLPPSVRRSAIAAWAKGDPDLERAAAAMSKLLL